MKPRSLLLVVVFLAGLFALDRGIGLALSRVFERLETGAQVGLANYAIRQTDAQIVVFGSSRAVYHVDPAVLERELGLTAFNAGSPGQSIRYARAIEAMLLDNGSRARLFLLHVDPKNLWGDRQGLQRLAPFYGRNPAVDALLEATSPTARWKLQVASYRYNSLLLPMLGNLLRDRPSPGNGFRVIPEDRPRNLEPVDEPWEPGEIHEDMSRLYVDFIEAAREQDVAVALVDGPRWRPAGRREVDRIGHAHLEALAREHGAAWIVIDERSDPVFGQARWFADVAHLTGEGARVFSERLAEQLRPLLRHPVGTP